MAGKSENLKQAGQKDSPVSAAAPEKPASEAVYTVDEFVRAAPEVFPGIRRECIMAAFKVAGVKSATVKGAGKIVNDFCKKEVK